MMRCYICGRTLARAAATVTTPEGTGYAGPTCARRAGLIPERVRRAAAVRPRRRRETGQMELAA